MRREIIKAETPLQRTACKHAMQAHKEKYGDYAPLGKLVTYKVKCNESLVWVEITSRTKSYVARIQN